MGGTYKEIMKVKKRHISIQLLPGSSDIKSRPLIKLSYIASLSIIVLFFSCATSFAAREITVKPGTKFNTLQKALQSAQNGDVIKVTASTYYVEDILIDKSISLIGIGNPVLDGQKKSNVLIITAPRVTIKGFVIRNSGVSNIKDKAINRFENAASGNILKKFQKSTCLEI